ncbi:MAG: InlB B-repeat-containing protein, partial [Alphaproteobacteria bacterium]|nr:InlB B-repeat-containing protein [Alphaproteobacteria bacterium]
MKILRFLAVFWAVFAFVGTVNAADCDVEILLNGGDHGTVEQNCITNHYTGGTAPNLSPKCIPISKDDCEFTGYYSGDAQYYGTTALGNGDISPVSENWTNDLCNNANITLTAGWVCSHKVIYECGDGTGNGRIDNWEENYTVGNLRYANCNAPSGKSFKTWMVQGTNTTYAVGDTLPTPSSNVTLVAAYKDGEDETDCDVEILLNAGAHGTVEQNCMTNDHYTGGTAPNLSPKCVPIATDNCEFTGYYLGDTQYYGGAVTGDGYIPPVSENWTDDLCTDGSITLTAGWDCGTTTSPTITYDCGGGTSEGGQTVDTWDANYKVRPFGETKCKAPTGKAFTQWLLSGTQNTYYAPGDRIQSLIDDITLVAQYGIYVEYDCGEHGSATTGGPVIDYNIGNDYVVKTLAAAKCEAAPGYSFSGKWLDNKSGTLLNVGDTPEFIASAGLVAQYTPNTITINYDNDGHGTAPESGTCQYGTNFNLAAALTADDGYTFDGWLIPGMPGAIKSNVPLAGGTEIPCTSASLGVTSGSATITASWTEQPKISVTYDCGAPYGIPTTNDPVTDTNVGSDYAIQNLAHANCQEASGYTFAGKWLLSGTTDTTYVVGAIPNFTQSVTLIAQYTPNCNEVIFNDTQEGAQHGVVANVNGTLYKLSGDGTNWFSDSGCSIAFESFPLTPPTPTDGATFVGYSESYTKPWQLIFDKNGAQIQSNYSTNSAQNWLFAVYCDPGYHFDNDKNMCVPNTITLAYNNNGHGSAPAGGTCEYGGNFNLAAALTADDNYTFSGWQLPEGGERHDQLYDGGVQIPCTSEYLGVTSGSATITAEWAAPETYTATWACNSSQYNQTPILVASDSDLHSNPETGIAFHGSVTPPQTSVCVLNTDNLPDCFSAFNTRSGDRWHYNCNGVGSSVPGSGAFDWPCEDDLDFSTSLVSNPYKFSYKCSADGETVQEVSYNYRNCFDGITMPSSTICGDAVQNATFKWKVTTASQGQGTFYTDAMFDSGEVLSADPAAENSIDWTGFGARTFVGQWICNNPNQIVVNGVCVDTFTGTFRCQGLNGQYPFVNPNIEEFDDITGMRQGFHTTLPSLQLCELRTDLPSCGQTGIYKPSVSPSASWAYTPGSSTATPGDFEWPVNDHLTFSLNGMSNLTHTIHYDCGIAGGTAPGDFVVKYDNCNNVTITQPTGCNQIQGASFHKWKADNAAETLLDPGSYGQDWNLGAVTLTAQWKCDDPTQEIVNGECVDKTYNVSFVCEGADNIAQTADPQLVWQMTLNQQQPLPGLTGSTYGSACSIKSEYVNWADTASLEWAWEVPSPVPEGYGNVCGGGSRNLAGDTFFMNCPADRTIYGTVGLKDKTITYDCNGIVGENGSAPNDQTITYENRNNVTIADASSCNAGNEYVFNGWTVANDGAIDDTNLTNHILNPGTYDNLVWTVQDTVQLTASWECVQGYTMQNGVCVDAYTVKFSCRPGDSVYTELIASNYTDQNMYQITGNVKTYSNLSIGSTFLIPAVAYNGETVPATGCRLTLQDGENG